LKTIVSPLAAPGAVLVTGGSAAGATPLAAFGQTLVSS
jgi:hypothetical protein